MKWWITGLLCLILLVHLGAETMIVHTSEQDYTFNVEQIVTMIVYSEQDVLSIQTTSGGYDFHMLDDILSITFDGVAVEPGLEEVGKRVPIKFLKNYPNPFNPETSISFDTGFDAKVNLTIFNVKGQKVKTLVDTHMEKGSHHIKWQGTDASGKKVGGGVYFYRIQVGDKVITRKMLLLK